MISSFTAQEKKLLENILRFAKKKRIKLYLVGGYLRDIILKRQKVNPDIDFCLKRGAINFGRILAKEIKSGFVVLDKEHGCCRLVKRINPVRDSKVANKKYGVSNGVKDTVYTLDFTDFRGKNLESDLMQRDFTINALAAELENILKQNCHFDSFLIDPLKARADLKSKTIKAATKKGFDADPLRILRAFSLSAIFDFKIERETLRLIKIKREKLADVSYERIRDELFKILDRPDAFQYLLKLDKLRILTIILPEIEVMRGVKQGPYHHLDVWKHTLETIRQLEFLIQERKYNKEIQGYLNEVVSSERRRRALIKLGALLHDIGKPRAKRHKDGKTMFHGHERIGLEMTENIAKRLKLSNDELDSLEKMVFWHLRPGYLADNEEITPRATFRYFRDTAQESVSILLISIADQRSTKGPLTSTTSRRHHEKIVLNLIKEYFRRKKEKRLPRLISGDDLIEKFKLEPSPLIGKILSEVEELQAIGKIKTKKEALEVARKFIR